MASDQQVSAQAVLRAVMKLRRQGRNEVMKHLEQVERDLASYVMEEFSMVHGDILALGGPPKRAQRLQRRVECLALTCVLALREAHYELWQQAAAGTPLGQLDAPDDAGAKPGDLPPPGDPGPA